MSDCECLSGCIFFNDKMAEKPAMAHTLKNKFCLGDNSNCARHMVFEKLGKRKVPADLYPSQVDRVKDIIDKG